MTRQQKLGLASQWDCSSAYLSVHFCTCLRSWCICVLGHTCILVLCSRAYFFILVYSRNTTSPVSPPPLQVHKCKLTRQQFTVRENSFRRGQQGPNWPECDGIGRRGGLSGIGIINLKNLELKFWPRIFIIFCLQYCMHVSTVCIICTTFFSLPG